MNNLKTAFVVVVMLAVLYGVYLVLNKPEPTVQGTGEEPWKEAPTKMPDIGLGTPFTPGDDAPPRAPGAGSTAPRGAWQGPASGPESNSNPAPIPSDRDPREDLEPRGPHANESFSDRPDFSGGFPDGDALLERRAPPELDRDGGANEAPESPEDDLGQFNRFAPRPDAREYAEPQEGSPSTGASAFATSWAAAEELVRDGKYKQALAELTPFYGNRDLTSEEQTQLEDMLDPLAGKVIYSTEHLLEGPYTVASGESLREIAEKYDVPWELLQNINGIEDPNALAPETELKVVRGPFRAEIELGGRRLTLFAGNLYAGRFDIEVHESDAPLIGTCRVTARKLWPEYESREGTIDPNHPDNPYGQWLLDLGGGIKIHSSSPSPAAAANGCISLSPRDASDVYGILSVGSKVEIRR